MTAALDPTYAALALTACLLGINAGLSLLFRLGIAASYAWSALRMVVQLALVATVLTALFEAMSPGWTALAAAAMVAFAGREVFARQTRLRRWWVYGLGTGSLTVAATLMTLVALTVTLQPEPWWTPRYALPLLGMILGNTMTGTSLGLSVLADRLHDGRAAVEARLALGAARWEAVREPLRGAVRAALVPITNSMAASGLVFLPGMMTGQILAGAAPAVAVKYQILIMFLIAGGTGLGAILAVLGGVLMLTDARHRLRLERLRRV